MIFVTGDVHDMDMGGPDQACLRAANRGTEMECAVRYARLAAEHEIRVTLFVSGKALRDEPSALAELTENPFVEIGGHTWNSLQPTWKHLLRQRFGGSYYGSWRSQYRDITRTRRELEKGTGQRLCSWRTHAYRGDARTNRILEELGWEPPTVLRDGMEVTAEWIEEQIRRHREAETTSRFAVPH